MIKTFFILLVSLFFTACQSDDATEKATKTSLTATQTADKVVVAKNESKAPAVAEKKTEATKEDSGVALHQKNCSRCHGKDYYPKKDSKMDSYKRLHSMVGMCDAQLGTELFPEELQSITDYLNDSFYKFKK